MKRLWLSIALVALLLPRLLVYSQGTLQANSYNGSCQSGNVSVTIPGTQGSGNQKFEQSYPSCTVTVYLAGTTTLATIYADKNQTAKANPFTAGSNGYFQFYAANGQYDVRLSGGGIPAPFTLGNNQIGGFTTLDCSGFQGTNGGAKIASCINSLPSTGGVADATNITGPQTISQNIFAGVPATKPVTLLLGAATYTITVPQTIPSNNSAIRCRGTTMVEQITANNNLWSITGADDTIEDCSITGQLVANSAIISLLAGSTRSLIRHNTITNCGSLYCILASTTTGSRIINNSVSAVMNPSTGTAGIGAGNLGDVHYLWIEGNQVTMPVSTGDAIALSTTTTSDLGYITIANNILSEGSTNFCVEGGPFGLGTSAMHDIVVTGNSCLITASGISGGFSLVGSGTVSSRNITVSNNTYDGGGFAPGIGAVEIASDNGFAVTGNTFRNIVGGGGSCVQMSGNVDNGAVTGNTCSNYSGGSAFTMQIAINNGVGQNVIISNNTLEFAPGAASTGMQVYCNNTTAICRNFTIVGNTIVGDGTANSLGISLLNNGGAMSGATVDGNSIYKTALGIQFANLSNVSITNNIYDAGGSTGFGLSGGAGADTNFVISHNVFTSLNAGAIAYTLNGGIVFQGLSVDALISDNKISGVNTTPGGQNAITLISNSSATTQERIDIRGNAIRVSGTGQAIAVGCNAAETCQDILIESNSLVGDSPANSIAIDYTGGATINQRISISNNKIYNFGGCIYLPAPTSGRIFNNITDSCQLLQFGAGATNMVITDFNGTTFANLPAAFANGSMIYVTNATIANPCAAGGTGAILKRLNGVNVCN